jgi:AcrR family transcriptional regulator
MATEPEGLRERNKQRRADQILTAARDLLREDPAGTPSVERIAERAQVSPATVFNLVGTRERIWAALADQGLAEITARVQALPALAPHERAQRIATATAEALCADAAVYRAVLSHWRSSGRMLRADPTTAIIASLEAARAAGTVRDDIDLRAIGTLIVTACTGAAHQWAAELIDDAEFVRRSRDAVDVAFAAAAATHAIAGAQLAGLAQPRR